MGSPAGDRQVRRLQLSGGSTYMISLPRAWVEEMGAGAGDGMAVSRNANRSLTIHPGRESAGGPEMAEITAGKQDARGTLGRRMIAVYLAGYNTIRIRSRGTQLRPEHARAAASLVRTSMIGTEIIESSPEAITIRVLTGLPELSFETALKRMHLMASEMHADAVGCLQTGDAARAAEVAGMDDEVDRFGLYMRRNLALAVQDAGVLAEMGMARPSDCLGYGMVIGRIERIADHAVLIAKRTRFVNRTIEPAVMEEIRRISQESLAVFKESVRALLDRDYHLAEKTAGRIAGVVEDEKRFMSGVDGSAPNSTVIRFVLEDIRRTAEYSGDIAEVAIDGNIGSIIGCPP